MNIQAFIKTTLIYTILIGGFFLLYSIVFASFDIARSGSQKNTEGVQVTLAADKDGDDNNGKDGENKSKKKKKNASEKGERDERFFGTVRAQSRNDDSFIRYITGFNIDNLSTSTSANSTSANNANKKATSTPGAPLSGGVGTSTSTTTPDSMATSTTESTITPDQTQISSTTPAASQSPAQSRNEGIIPQIINNVIRNIQRNPATSTNSTSTIGSTNNAPLALTSIFATEKDEPNPPFYTSEGFTPRTTKMLLAYAAFSALAGLFLSLNGYQRLFGARIGERSVTGA